MFDAPHTDERVEGTEFVAHTFLCGVRGLLDLEREEPLQARAILGFGWGFRGHGDGIEIARPEPLGPEHWDAHRERLSETHPGWEFAGGYREGAAD